MFAARLGAFSSFDFSGNTLLVVLYTAFPDAQARLGVFFLE
jgi:hypothetical protein